MPTHIYPKIKGAFCFDTAPFAVHPTDRLFAALYLVEAIRENISLDQALGDVREYLISKECHPNFISQQLGYAREHFAPWLSN